MMQASALLAMNLSRKRFFSTTSWKSKRVGWTVDELIERKGPRCLKPHRVMWKFLDKTKKQGIFSQPPVGAPSINLETAVISVAGRSIADSKRSTILNKILMGNITEILATSDIGLLLSGHDIQITRVRINFDYSAINVFWIPHGSEADVKVQSLLNKVANPLRSELIGLRVMGIVPRVQFVKDKQYALMAEVDRRLKIADFGDDHVPALKEHDHLREDLQLITSLPKELKENIVNLEEDEPFNEDEEIELPEMRMDVFGLNYVKTLRTIKRGIAEDVKPKEQVEDIFGNPKAIFEIPSNAILDRQSWDKDAFKKYIKQRNINIRKARQLAQPYEAPIDSKLEIIKENYEEDFELLYSEFVKNSFKDECESLEDYDERQYVEQ